MRCNPGDMITVDFPGATGVKRRPTMERTIARVLFCICQGNMVLLHGFIKKTQKTPTQDLDSELKRKKKLEAGK